MMGRQLPGADMLEGSGSQLGTISGYDNGGRGAPGIQWVETRDAAQYPTGHRTGPHNTEVGAEAEKSYKRGIRESTGSEWTPDLPQQAQAPAGEPGEGAGIIGQLSHDHLVAGRTTHLDRAVEKGDGLLHVDCLHSN